MLLNGALGDVDALDPASGGAKPSMHDIGGRLAAHTTQLLPKLHDGDDVALGARSTSAHLLFRALDATPPRGEQRFGDDELYERTSAAVATEAAEQGRQPAEVQGLRIGEHLLIGMPAELFAWPGSP